MTELSILGSGSILDLQMSKPDEQEDTLHFPGSKNEEALVILAKIRRHLEGKGDWLKCDALFDAVVSLIKETTDPKYMQEKRHIVGHERDPSYFNEPITMSISLDDVKKYLTDVARGVIQISFESNEFVQSPYHLQRLAVLKLEKLFPPELSSEVEDYRKLKRQIQFRILLSTVTQSGVIDDMEYNLLYSYFVQDRRMIDPNDEGQVQEIIDIMLKVLTKEPKHSNSFLILQALLDEHSFHKATVRFCEKVIKSALQSWKSKGNNDEILLFLNELQEPLSSTVDIFPFLKAFYEDTVAIGEVDESSLYQALLADGSQTLCEKLQVIVNSYRKHMFPLETPDEVVQSILSICLLKSEAHMWRMLHYASRKLHQHCLEIVLQMLVSLVQRSLFHDLRTVLTRQVFAPMKSLVLLLGWKYVFLDFEAAKRFLSAIEHSEKTNPSHSLDALSSSHNESPSFEHPELQKKAETIKNQIDLINWCNEQFSKLSPECTVLKQHPSVVFNGLDHYTPLYVLNSSTNIGVLPKSAVIAQLSNKLLYNSSSAETDSQRDIETYHAFDAIQIACKALLQSCRHEPDSSEMYEGVTNKLLKELTKVLSLILQPQLQVETLENLFSLLFVKYSQLEPEIMSRFEIAASSSMLAAQLTEKTSPSMTGSIAKESVPALDPMVLQDSQMYRPKSLSVQELSPRSFSISVTPVKEKSPDLRTVTELETTGSRSSDGYSSNAVGKFSESGFVASIPFIRDLLHILKQGVAKLSEVKTDDNSFTDRLTKFETVLDEAVNRFLFVTTLKVGENFGKFCPDADYLCGFPEKSSLCLRRGTSETPHDAFSCIDQMLSDPISLVFKCIWRKDFDMAERVVDQYGLQDCSVEDILRIEKSYEALFKNVSEYALKEARSGGGRSLRRGAFTLDEESDDDADVSVLDKIVNRASMTLESMTVPQMVEHFVLGCDKEHNATKFLDRNTKDEYLKYMIDNTDISVRFDLICTCALSVDLTIDLSQDVWDEVGEKLQLYEPKRNSGEIGGFNYAVVTLKNLLEGDACQENSLVEVLSDSSVPIEAEKHKYFADRQKNQVNSRKKLLKILDSALTTMSKHGHAPLTSSTRVTTTSTATIAKSRFPRLTKVPTHEVQPAPSPSVEEVPDEAARNELHEAVKDFLKAFCAPDPVLRSLYFHSSRRDVPFESEPPSRVLFLDVFYEYVKKFASYLIEFDKKFTKNLGQPWNLRTPDDKIVPVKKLYECPFLLLTQSPTEIVCDMVFNKNEALSSLEKMCEDLFIDLSELVCNRLQVSLPWRCLTLLYNADSVMGCSQKPLNLLEVKFTVEEDMAQTSPDLGDTISIISSSDIQLPVKSPNKLVEDILDRVVDFFAKNFNNSGVIKGEDLMAVCDNFDLESILDETSALENIKCQSLENDEQRFAFFCNVYNLMMIHGSVLEAKAIKSQKDHMGLSCIIGGSVLERLAFELRLEYSLGEFGTLSAWQIRNCVLRKGRRPWKAPNFVKPFFDALEAFSTLQVESVKNFNNLEEQFLLIDCTVFSPVLQIVKPEEIREQVENSKNDWLQKFVQFSRTGVKVPQLLQEYLWDKYESDFRLSGSPPNYYSWISGGANFDLFKNFLEHYLEPEEMNSLKALASKGIYQVDVCNDFETFHSWKVQYDFNTIAGFADIMSGTTVRVTTPGADPVVESLFFDGLHLCERPDRRLCKTYPLQDSIKKYLASKNQVQGRLIEMIHEVTDVCHEIEHAGSTDREVRTSTSRGFSFTLTSSTSASIQGKTTVDYMSILQDIINSKVSDSFKVYKVWAEKILEPLSGRSSSNPESFQKLLCAISEHGLLSGSKCPKVVKRCFANLQTILRNEENSKDLSLKLAMMMNLLKQESVNEARFQPLFDLLLCVQAFADGDKVFAIQNVHIRNLFMLKNLERFSLEFALDFLNAANREEIENPHLKRCISLKFREVYLFRQILKLFPTKEKLDRNGQWVHVKEKFEKPTYDDIIKRVCTQYSRFKMAKMWCELNPNVDVEIREQVLLLSMKDFAKKGRIIRFIEALHQSKFPRNQLFHTCQEVLKCCDVTSSCIVITFLLDKITSAVFDFFSDPEIDVLRHQFLSLLMLKEVPNDVQCKYLHLIRTPNLIIDQLFMNSDIESLKKIFLKVSVIYASQHLEEKKFLGEEFITHNSIEALQKPILHYARLAMKLEPLLLSAYVPKIGRSDSLTSLVSVASNKEPEELSLSAVIGQTSTSGPKIRIITEMDPEWVKDNEATHCCICGVEFGYVLARRHHCRTCGRVICSKCRNFHEINNTPISVCLNCLKTRAIQEAIGTQTASIAHGRERSDTNAGKGGNFGDSNSLPPNIAKLDSSMFDDQNDGKAAFWKLPSAEEDAHEVIGEFFYTNAPSFCLFESILALHFNVDEVVNFLFAEVKTISEYFNIQKKRDPSESASANSTANMGVMFLMQNLMGMAQSKIQRGNSTKSATAEIETIAEPYNFYNFKISPSVDQINELEKEFDKLSLGIEALQLLLRIEYDSIPNLATIMDSKTHNENVIMQLMKQGKYTEALEFCQKCDLDAKQVYKRWGLSALKTGALDEARAFFKKCLDSSRSLKNEDLVKEIIETMETNVMNPTPSTFKSFEDFWAKMEDELKSEIPLLTNNLQRLEECAFYVETYLPCRNLVSFYADRGEMKRALDVFTDSSNLITAEDFNKNLFKVAVQLGEKDGGGSHIEELLKQIQESNTDKAFWRKFLLPIASNSDTYKPEIMVHLHLALEDYVRAGEDWCRIYDGVIVESYKQLYEKHSHLLDEADQCFDHASQNLQSPGSKLEGNKYLTSTELNCLKGKVDLQRQVAEFLSNSNVDHFPEVAKKTTQSSSGHLTGQEASKKGMPTLLGREDQSVRVVAALLAEYQSGTGFNLATDAIKFLHLNLDEVGVMVARELQAGDRFRSILYLASSFSGSRDPALSGYTDRFLSTCVEVYVDRHGEPAPGPQLNRLKELVEKIKNIDARISCFIAMGDLQQAQLQIVKKDRNGIDDMLKIIDLAESGKYKGMVNLDQFITMCRMWLRKFDKTEETTES